MTFIVLYFYQVQELIIKLNSSLLNIDYKYMIMTRAYWFSAFQ